MVAKDSCSILTSFESLWIRLRGVPFTHPVECWSKIGRLLWLLVICVFLAHQCPASHAEVEISFVEQIRPILSDKCFACHGPDGESRASDLRLDQRASAIQDLGGYAAIVSGDADSSELITRIMATDDSQMPPVSANNSLSETEKELLRQWIAQGAKYETHWAYRPIKRPPISSAGSSSPATNAIDVFLDGKIQNAGIRPAPPADDSTLVKRLYVDLLGVPPEPGAIENYANDTAQNSWEALVDRLLADPRFGERMAVFWLDLVRYADTIGYHSDNFMEVSPYRDYVIGAFNDNLPFDRFTVEQLAGDLLPNPSQSQLIASGYNRLLQTTEEGGAQAREYIAIYAADRVRNFSTNWLGATMGCAQCHDHKYDPITMRDFYSMAAFFADIAEQPVGGRYHNMLVPTADQTLQLKELYEKLEGHRLESVLAKDTNLQTALARGQRAWEQTTIQNLRNDPNPWTSPQPIAYSSDSRLKLELMPDNSILASDAEPYHVAYEVVVPVSGTVHALRLEALTHHTFKSKGGFGNNSNTFVLSEIEVVREKDGQQIGLASAESEHELPDFPVHNLVDSNRKSGWAAEGNPDRPSVSVVVRFDKPMQFEVGEQLRIYLIHQSVFGQLYTARFRLSFTADETAPLKTPPAVPQQVLEAIQAVPAERTSQQQLQIAQYYYLQALPLSDWREQRDQLFTKKHAIENNVLKTLVTESLDKPRDVRILPRGDWQDDSGEIVEPAIPAFLFSGLPSDQRLSRLDLARWVTSNTNPLTARVFVNRLWKLYFGRGLSSDLADFGGQGVPPSHPELLDWLAAEFMDSGWDIKHLVKQIVISTAYQRSSVPTFEQTAKDPMNRLLARQNRWRLEAEFVRDSILSISGLLDMSRIGGRSVYPYQPEGYWKQLNFPPRKWQHSSGKDLYRRSLYTFWCRSFLHPAMIAFDAPSREECTAERTRSNTPQQALVLMNEPAFVEASQVMAERVSKQDGSARQRVAWVVRQSLLREPTREEVELLTELYINQRAFFMRHPDQAAKLITTGASQADGAASDLAAWTQVSRTILSAYETTSRF